MPIRLATPADASEIAVIYNQGIEDRLATFETRFRAPQEIEQWFDGIHPVLVSEQDGQIVAFASTSSYRARECYAGIAECSVYVRRDWRGRGAGRQILEQLCVEANRVGFWKLVSRVFVENTASRALLRSFGFREVGTYERHGKLDGVWRNVIIVEYLLQNAYDDNTQKAQVSDKPSVS